MDGNYVQARDVWDLGTRGAGVCRDLCLLCSFAQASGVIGAIFSLVRPSSPLASKIGNAIWEMFHLLENLHFSRGWPTDFWYMGVRGGSLNSPVHDG